MRLWHQQLIPYLPRQQILGQHRECCALRGRGWKKKHKTVDYVFEHSPQKLYRYHILVMAEMHRRGFEPDPRWLHPCYRGKNCLPWPGLDGVADQNPKGSIYPEHDRRYLQECLDNLAAKGINIDHHVSRPVEECRGEKTDEK